MENEAQREKIVYEYRVISTPEYAAHIDENWELHKVFNVLLENGYPNIILAFRRKMN